MPRTTSTKLINGSAAGSKKQKVKGPVRPSNAYLASLKAATLRTDTKAALPLELIAQILDFCPPADLIRCARASKRLQEMVYEDTRWTQKLRLMGLWDEAEARQRFEQSMKRKSEARKSHDPGATSHTGIDLPGHMNGDALGGRLKPAETLFDAHTSDVPPTMHINGHSSKPSQDIAQLSLQPNGLANTDTRPRAGSLTASLDILQDVKSIRGRSRQEFGKIYAALETFYLDIAQAQSNASVRVFRSFADPKDQAKMFYNLRVYSKADVYSGAVERTAHLRRVIASFEHAALSDFEGGLYAREYDGRMHKYAHVLTTLDEGTSVVDMFIDKNPVLHQKSRYGKPLACLENPSASSVDLKPSQSFFHALSRAFDEQVAIIDRVFPPSTDVMIPLLVRVAEEVIAGYMTPLFDEAYRYGTDTYAQIVAGVYEQSLRFVTTLYPPSGSADDFHAKAVSIIIHCFEPHVERYLAAELSNLESTTETEVSSWEKRLTEEEQSAESFFMSNINRQAAKRDFMTSFKKVIMLPVTVLPVGRSAPKTSTSHLTTPSLDKDSRSSTPGTPQAPEPPTTELAAKAAIMNARLEGISSLFSIEVALHLVHAAKSSIERCALFVALPDPYGSSAKSTCQAIFVHLLSVLGHRHIQAGFDKAVQHLSAYDARSAFTDASKAGDEKEAARSPLLTFLELVNVGDLIQQMLDLFYTQQLLSPHLVAADDFLDPAVKAKKRFESMLDERVAAGLNRGIDVLMDEVEMICATTQKAEDFRPGVWSEKGGAAGGAAVPDIGATSTAKRVVALVEKHTGMLTGSTDKNTLDVFNGEVGLRLFSALCKHIKRQRISTDGAINLICDTNLYFSFIQSLKNRELLAYFKALREVAQIYLVDGSEAKELALIVSDAERYGGVFRVEEVLEFAERRSDWYSIKSSVDKALYGMGCAVM